MDLFALLRAGVRSGDTPDIGGSTDDRWRELYTAASSQGVSALVWDGIRRLPPESQPSRELRLRWAYNVERIERRYGQQRRRAAELAAAYAEAGIRTVVLKGLAVSRLYPVPEHRPCGDLDCFLCGDYERGNRVAEQFVAEVKRDFYKHSHIVFRGLTVENHRFCTAVRGSRRAKRFERHLQRLLAEGPLSCIPETALLVPPPDFNALFLAKHALSHFLTEGISCGICAIGRSLSTAKATRSTGRRSGRSRPKIACCVSRRYSPTSPSGIWASRGIRFRPAYRRS